MFLRSIAFVAAFVVVLFSLPPSLARAGDDAAALLAKHRAYVGWQLGDGTFNTLRLSGQRKRSKDGETKVVSTWTTLQANAIFRTIVVGDDGSSPGAEYGFTGNVFWESDENGFTHPDYSPYQGYEVSRSVLFGEATSELTGTLQGPKAISGETFPVVRIEPPHGVPIDLYVDPATGAYRRAVLDPDGSYETTFDALQYREVIPGKRMISGYEVGRDAVALTKIEPNVNLTAADLHPPGQVATWDFANANPFRIDVKPHAIFLDATVNGVKGRFILDTGASDLALDTAFASRAHLQMVRGSEASGIGGDIKTSVQRADTVTVGGNTLHNVRVTTGRFDMHEDDENVNGLIGFPLFAGAIVTLNTGAQTMAIADPAAAPVDRSAGYPVIVDLSYYGTPLVPMVINHGVKVNALLDLGNGGTVMMSPNIVSKRHIPFLVTESDATGDPLSREEYVESHYTMTGIGGSVNVRCATIGSISLGPIEYQNTFACVNPQFDSSDFVIMGYDFLKQFDYVFDYHDGLIMMKPHPQ